MTLELSKELKSFKEFDLASQRLRSGTSIGANVNEAGAAVSKKDFVNKMSIALKEARESWYWLRLLKESKTIEINVEQNIDRCISSSKYVHRSSKLLNQRLENEQQSTQNASLKTQNSYLDMDMLRFTTAGSVDDGKSTLIGRLLYDSKSIFEDQLEAIEKTSKSSGEEEKLSAINRWFKSRTRTKDHHRRCLSLFRYPKEKIHYCRYSYHTQYTRNMVTGASTADLAIILVDASKGILTQSRRHAFISSLLRIPHMVVAINKMDLVNYKEEVFNEIVSDFEDFARKLNVKMLLYPYLCAERG